MLCGYLLIYNIFDIGVMQDIQEFGMMKTIGMTGKQIKRLMRKQMLFTILYWYYDWFVDWIWVRGTAVTYCFEKLGI